jgi:hypothetical protein
MLLASQPSGAVKMALAFGRGSTVRGLLHVGSVSWHGDLE